MTLELAARPTTDLDPNADLDAQLAHHYQQAHFAARDVLTHAIAAGRLLHEAQLGLGHGQWGAWLDEHFPGSDRTARAWMQLARAERETPDILATIGENPTVAAALKAIAAPATPSRSPSPGPRPQTITLDPDTETYVLTIQQLQALIASFGGQAPIDRVRRWIERLTEPKITHCPDCGQSVLEAVVKSQTIRASPYEWQPRTRCTKCIQTRNAHPGRPVSCPHCNSTGWTGTADRPPGRMLAMDMAWSDTPNLRIIGERTDRREGEALHPLHTCPATMEQAA